MYGVTTGKFAVPFVVVPDLAIPELRGQEPVTKTRAILASYLGTLAFAAFLFLGAGKLLYGPAHLYVVLALVGVTLNHALARPGSDITVERAKGAGAGEAWDRRILGAYFLVSLAMFVTAGLDSGRFGWSGPAPLGATVAGVALMLSGQVLFALAKRENDFFLSTAAIQTERDHRVCTTGPYGVVRHPGYLGMLLSLLAFPLVLQSSWAFVPASVGAALLLLRTALEDRFLHARLAGYPEYAATVRWRLIPGVF
ncbi:MAG: hypothetical protein AMXMBFR53_15800 [Gemmatimonadota bacterium]